MENKLNEKQLLAQIHKNIEKTEKDVKSKYQGVLFFIQQLEQKEVSVFELLRTEYIKLPIGKITITQGA